MKIAFVGQPEYFRIFYRDMMEKNSGHDCVEIPIRIAMPQTYSALIGETFDIIFFFRGEFCPEQVLKNCNGLKVAINTEPMPSDYRLNPELEHRFNLFNNIHNMKFDYIFHYDKTSIAWLINHNIHIDGEFYLPVSNPYPPPEKDLFDTVWDISFFGRSNQYREQMMGALKRDYNVIHVAHGMSDYQMQYISQRSRIALNLNTNELPSLNPRLQILLSYGNMVLSEKLTHNDVFTSGVHYIEVNEKNIYKICRNILANEGDETIATIQSQGNIQAVENLNCLECWENLINKIKG